ncbi:CLUMA_CG010493, isoform A [Clunio marinus]|uniref:CLUMA_CG010493, isoform A n=1 Tax=Clunio marinus TaxID=568069 RepID=A0A1J1IF59_9DIPT|nr:CLUMA_CG010493, isoform A [Clunio marinus]
MKILIIFIDSLSRNMMLIHKKFAAFLLRFNKISTIFLNQIPRMSLNIAIAIYAFPGEGVERQEIYIQMSWKIENKFPSPYGRKIHEDMRASVKSNKTSQMEFSFTSHGAWFGLSWVCVGGRLSPHLTLQ